MTRSAKIFGTFVLALVAGVAACSQDAGPPADTIFHGDNIVTMDPQQPTVEAVAVRGEIIVAAGSRDEVMALQGPSTRVVDLGDNALLPGFIDSHGHFLGAGRDQTSLGLHPPPVGDVNNIDDLVRKVRAWIDEHDIPAGEAVTGRGYDDSLLEEGRHPTREDLDRASTEHPIVLTHVSGHLTTTNSAALEVSNITADTPDPPGGHVRRIEGSMEPNGVLEETARGLLAIDRYGTPSTMEEMDELIRRSIDVYLSHGTTTIQDGGTAPMQAEAFQAAANREPFKADVAAFVRFNETPADLASIPYRRDYQDGFRVGGVKLMLDGSPQGRTAWVTIPYEEGPPGAPPDYVAYGVMVPGEYKAAAAELIQGGIPIIVHANGDAAMDLMIDGVDEAVADMEPMPDHRSVIIHAQLMRADQLDRSAELNIVPSFFAAHAFFWGDWHRISFGEDRGNNTSPMGWALERGVNFTIHNDASVVPPHMMRLVSIAVNRKTRSGHILGPHQRLTVMQALYAVTLGGAYQYFEEDTKGSITVGKQADLVILDESPLTADPANLEFIPILETFSRGRSVFTM